VIAFCPLASGLLTSKYLSGDVPPDSRAARDWARAWVAGHAKEERRRILGALDALARARGQTLAQMALAWVLRHRGMVSTVMGASRPEQVDENVAALAKLQFSADELARIDELTI
jgi:L-glyceraldehyde 3-phosphate reductase